MDVATPCRQRHADHRLDDRPPVDERRRRRRSVALNNTVVLQHPYRDDVWCLGFVEDVADAGGALYISFHCEALPPRWIASHLLYEHSLCTPKCHEDTYVALRASSQEPLVLHLAVVVERTPGVTTCQSAVCLAETSLDGPRHFVHLLQMVVHEPARSLAGAGRREGAYVKYTLPLPVPAAHADRICVIDENRLLFEVKRAGGAAYPAGLTISAGPYYRFFFRLERSSAVFICWEYEQDPFEPARWTAQLLADCVQRCLDCGALAVVMPVEKPLPPADVDQGAQVQMADLPVEIIRDVMLDYVDIFSQASLRRVSPGWNAVWTQCAQPAITLDWRQPGERANHHDEVYRLARLLQHALRPAVRTLAVTRWRPDMCGHESVRGLCGQCSQQGVPAGRCSGYQRAQIDVDIIGLTLRNRNRSSPSTLRRIVLHQCVVALEFAAWHSQRPMHCLSRLTDLCQELLLVDYVMNDAWRNFHPDRYALQSLQRKQRFTYTGRDPLPQLSVRIPFLRFDCALTDTAHFNTLRAAMEAALPDVSSSMRDTAAAMHAYWASTAALYPHLYPVYAHFLRNLMYFAEPKPDPDAPLWSHLWLLRVPDQDQLPSIYQLSARSFSNLTVFVICAMWCATASAAETDHDQPAVADDQHNH
ncbi:uncharacterized protein LOC129587359 [Paramacrobiotus metropolitanus]|uniref:uncharacterized protein LOC129587359 n=1 Tax=Paramacrobiotus metropolitanus TaxID=2943436 RepID=UPI0024463A4E|nr:uncharacterized protein LOC129587359 [Paramacrobiotus metropolitanus]